MIEDKYIYLLGSLVTLALLVPIFILRKDMRRFIVKAGIVGGFAGLVSEFWYFKDYWVPPTTTGVATSSPEDFIFGFAFVALGATIFPFFLKQPHESSRGGWKWTTIWMLAFVLLGLVVLTNILGINSLIASTILMFALVVYILIRQPKLWRRAALGAAALGVYVMIAYALLIAVLSPHYIERYYTYVGQSWNPWLLGYMPLIELIWYLAVGALTPIVFEYIILQSKAKKTAK
jgi:hypothetical protein